MNTTEKALDDTECDETSDIDPFDRLSIVDCPLMYGDARPQGRVKLQKDGPRRALIVYNREFVSW
jgi:hypothetical protein